MVELKSGLSILEDYDEYIGAVFCGWCEWKGKTSGRKDDTGIALEPDEEVCQYGCDHPSDERCARHRKYIELMEKADEVADYLASVEDGDDC